jgi:hypothetical protein
MRSAHGFFVLVSSLAVGCAAVPTARPQSDAAANANDSAITVLVGNRSMTDDDNWSPLEDQLAFELGFNTVPSDWPVGIEASVSYSDDDDSGVEGETKEASLGVRKTWDVSEGRVHPYVGGGLAGIQAEFSGFGQSDDDTSVAGYVHGGVGFDLGSHFLIGVDVRLLLGSDITLFGIDGDADYVQYGLMVGYAF